MRISRTQLRPNNVSIVFKGVAKLEGIMSQMESPLGIDNEWSLILSWIISQEG